MVLESGLTVLLSKVRNGLFIQVNIRKYKIIGRNHFYYFQIKQQQWVLMMIRFLIINILFECKFTWKVHVLFFEFASNIASFTWWMGCLPWGYASPGSVSW